MFFIKNMFAVTSWTKSSFTMLFILSFKQVISTGESKISRAENLWFLLKKIWVLIEENVKFFGFK